MALGGVQTLHILTTGTSRCASSWNIPRLTFDGFSIPSNIRRGLPYIDMCPHTDLEWEELPHVLLTEDTNWDPTHLDHEQGDDPAWYEQQNDPPLLNSDFNLGGDYCHRILYKSVLTSNMYTPTG
jgi:hypothetical protein